MGVIAEKTSDDKGLAWPTEIAPYKYYLAAIGENGTRMANDLYRGMSEEVLYDDRDVRPGEKFADSELLGLPYRVVVSDRGLEKNEIEVIKRTTGEKRIFSSENFSLKDIDF